MSADMTIPTREGTPNVSPVPRDEWRALGETLAAMREWHDDDLHFLVHHEVGALLSAVEKVLALCDEYEQPRHSQKPLAGQIRKALTDALGDGQ